ncbi:MAG: polysaccharide deacetylase family protein [Clostridiales bacterium]|jgi:peptidoglycan-N-acetylmuramic acid deacetylase|nr:polysaccharide deacetylase family protein [Clostridiales bacterium]
MEKLFVKILSILFLPAFLAGCAAAGEREAAQGTGYQNTKIQWGVKKTEGEPPQIPAAWSEMLQRFDGYYLGGGGDSKKIFLTFDEGYEAGYTAPILDTLKEKNVPAAFFVTGAYLDKEGGLVRRMTDEGHIVGNHTVNHPSMPEVADDQKLEAEINGLEEKFFRLTGLHMKYLRPPKGEFSERTLAISQKLGYKTVLWSNAYVDWTGNGNSAKNALTQVTKYLHDGCIILLHAVSRENADALGDIINSARDMGYTFAGLEEL